MTFSGKIFKRRGGVVWSKSCFNNFSFYLGEGLFSSYSIRSAYVFVMKGVFTSKFGSGDFCG